MSRLPKPTFTPQPQGKHHPSVCGLKGMFGRDCKNCDATISPPGKKTK